MSELPNFTPDNNEQLAHEQEVTPRPQLDVNPDEMAAIDRLATELKGASQQPEGDAIRMNGLYHTLDAIQQVGGDERTSALLATLMTSGAMENRPDAHGLLEQVRPQLMARFAPEEAKAMWAAFGDAIEQGMQLDVATENPEAIAAYSAFGAGMSSRFPEQYSVMDVRVDDVRRLSGHLTE